MKGLPEHGSTSEHTVVFGFGSQGRAQALNLRDSKIPLTVCIREGSSTAEEARAAGITMMHDPKEAARKARRRREKDPRVSRDGQSGRQFLVR